MKTRSLVVLSLLVAATSTASGSAQAEECPTPSLVQCRDPAYLGTACGQAAVANETSTCSVQLRAAYQTEVQRPDVSVGEVMVPGQPGVTTAAGVKKYGYTNHLARSFPGEFLGVEQKTQLATAWGGQLNLLTDGVTRFGLVNLKAQTDAWAANGNNVQSCAEFTSEKFRGYTAFKALADTSLSSDEALYDKAFDPATGIANKTLYSKSGASALPSVAWPSNGVVSTIIINGKPQQIIDPRAPKNGFFKAYKSLAKGSFFTPADAALKLKLSQGQSHHIVDWNWHKQMHDTVATSYDHETLRVFEDKQADFIRLAAERETVLALIAKYGNTMQSGDPPVTRDLRAELAGIEAALRSELAEAEAEGCLDPVNPSRCDWSFKQVRDQVGGFYSKQMESSFQKCVDITGDDFTSTSLIRRAQTRFGAPKQDYSTSTEDVEAFQGVVANWVAQQSATFPVDENGKPYIGDHKSDSGTIGSGELSLDWAYDVGWGIQNLTKTEEACKAGLKVNGSFSATGHAYGTDLKVIDAQTELTTEQQTGKAKVKLIVLDRTVWDKWDSPYTTELQAGLTKEFKSGTEKKFTTTIYPFGIPVTLSAGVGMSVGLKVNAKAAVGGSCLSNPTATIDLATVSGTITPWAQADAFGSAAVGIPGFQAGIKCNVVIVRGEMPLTANAKITMNAARHVDASASFSGKQTFRMLDGTIKAFLDGPFDFMDSEWTVFSWQGPKIDQEIFRFEKSTMPLTEMKAAL